MNRFLLLLIIPFSLLAYVDSDMDGVEDKDDLCPNTSITDLVDLTGCSIKSLISPHHFSFTSGIKYAKDESSSYIIDSIDIAYYYKKLSLQLSSSYYNLKSDTSTDSGLNDTYLNLFYRVTPLENFSLTMGGGVAFPTYDSSSNQTDYTLSLYGRYYLDKWSISAGVGEKFVGDSNTTNASFYSLSTGYSWSSKFYSSLGYYLSETIYNQKDSLETLSFYSYYGFNQHWFGTLTIVEGLNSLSLDRSIGVKLGYYW